MPNHPFTVADYLLTRLSQAGLDRIFSVPGDYCANFLDALLAFKGIEYVGTVTELGAGYAADGYGRFKGIGAACVQYGVGTFSVLNATAGSFVERVPVVVISASPSTANRVIARQNGVLFHHATGNFFADRNVFSNVTVASEIIYTAAEAPSKIDGALQAALTHRRPIYLEALSDVWGLPCEQPNGTITPLPSSSDSGSLKAAVQTAWDRLTAARFPVIWAGIDIQRFGLQKQLLALLKATGFPFTTTSLAKTVIDESHPQFIGTYAGPASLPFTRAAIKESDCILALGTMVTDDYLGVATKEYDRMVLSDAQQTRTGYQFYQGVVLQDFLPALLKSAKSIPKKPGWRGIGKSIQPKFNPSDPLTYNSFFALLDQFLVANNLWGSVELILGESSSLYVAGNLMGLPVESIVGQAAWGSLGHETGCALGVAMATGKRPIVVAGDGGFMMQAQELSVLARHQIPAIVFVMSNEVYAIEQAFVNLEAFEPNGTFAPFDILPKWDYLALAQAMGVAGWRVQTVQELRDLAAKLKDATGPALVEVVIPQKDLAPQIERLAKSPTGI